MKKILLFLAVIAVLTSCNKDLNLDMKYQLTATITAIDVVKNIKDIANSDLFPNGSVGEGEKIRISVFIYDQSDKLIIEESRLLNTFAEVLTLDKPIKEGNYTIICCADVVDADNLTTVNTEFWKFENKDLLQNLKATFPSNMQYYSFVLGYSKQSISINKSQVLNISLKPAGSMVTLDFDYLNLSQIQTIKMGIITWNNYLSLSDAIPNTSELLNDGNVFALEKGEYRNKIKSIYCLPSNKLTIKWVGLNAAGNQIKSGTIPSTALVAGQNKIYTIDTSTGLITLKSASINSVGKQVKESGKIQSNLFRK